MDLINHSEPAQTMSNILVDCICEDLNQGERGEQNDISGTPHSQLYEVFEGLPSIIQ